MTDNVIKFPKRETEPKTDRTPEMTSISTVADLMGKTLADIITHLRKRYPTVYFDPHLIVNDPFTLNTIQRLIEHVIKLGEERDPKPTGPITDHKS